MSISNNNQDLQYVPTTSFNSFGIPNAAGMQSNDSTKGYKAGCGINFVKITKSMQSGNIERQHAGHFCSYGVAGYFLLGVVFVQANKCSLNYPKSLFYFARATSSKIQKILNFKLNALSLY